jgi:Fe-S cluster assembly iron-binding protein IscA
MQTISLKQISQDMQAHVDTKQNNNLSLRGSAEHSNCSSLQYFVSLVALHPVRNAQTETEVLPPCKRPVSVVFRTVRAITAGSRGKQNTEELQNMEFVGYPWE